MRLGHVIGRVTLSQTVPSYEGGRFLIVSPWDRDAYREGVARGVQPLSEQPSLVVYDDLGGGVGDVIGFIEGREAASAFDEPTPIDSINAALIDSIFYQPQE